MGDGRETCGGTRRLGGCKDQDCANMRGSCPESHYERCYGCADCAPRPSTQDRTRRNNERRIVFATSNSWRRFVYEDHSSFCEPAIQRDGHVDLRIREQDGERMAACWNACAGMPDPAAEIAKLRAEVEHWKMSDAVAGRSVGLAARLVFEECAKMLDEGEAVMANGKFWAGKIRALAAAKGLSK